MGSNRLGEAVELDQHGALVDAPLIRFCRGSTGEEAPTAGKDGRNSKFRLFVACHRVGDRAIADNPICLGHCIPLICSLGVAPSSHCAPR